MIVLDTNVLSELIRPQPQVCVVDWLRQQTRATLFTTVITRAELFYGAFLLPEGRRKSEKIREIEGIFNEDMRAKLLSFDSTACMLYAQIAAMRKQAGRPISPFDAMIAAITQAHGATLATRNTKDFVDCGIRLVNPWEH